MASHPLPHRIARRSGSRLARRQTVKPYVETLEDRAVPATTIIEGIGANTAALQATVDSYRNLLGANNGVGPGVATGRREINWDGTPAGQSATNLLAPNFFNSNSPRGAVFGSSAGNAFQVSSVGIPGEDRFGNINVDYPNIFQTFSAGKLFTPLGTNSYDVNFFVSGTNTPGLSRGFGAVFTDVDLAGFTHIEYYDASGGLLLSRAVLPNAGNGGLSFLGVAFDNAIVARVRVIQGNVALGPNDTATTDVVAADDFIYGEPLAAGAGAQALAAIGAGEGASNVLVVNPVTQAVIFNLTPFGSFTGGARVAVGDVNSDGVSDIIVGAGAGGGPQVRVFDGRTGDAFAGPLGSFFAFPAGFSGGVFVAAGDVNGDGFADVIVGAGEGGGPQVSVYDGKTGNALGAFFALPSAFTGGVRVATGDLDNDGRAEIIAAAGRGGGPQVTIFHGTTFAAISSFFAFSPTYTGGVFVATGNVDGTGVLHIIVGSGTGGPPLVSVFDARTSKLEKTFVAFDPSFTGGVRVAVGDGNADGRVEIGAAAGPGGGPQLTSFDAATIDILQSAFVLAPTFTGGVFLAGR